MAPTNTKTNGTQIKKKLTAQPLFHQHAPELQAFGTVELYPIGLEEVVRREMCDKLNQLLADSITLRDLYKKSHWQVSGPNLYQLHLLFDKHYDEQVEIVDSLAERVQMLGGVSLAMGGDVAEATRVDRSPKGRELPAAQISRLLEAHELILEFAREAADRADKLGDDGTNDLLVSGVVRPNEMQVWFLIEHLVDIPTATVSK
jgi:starvation-inducible DNA-binding protein